MRSFIFVLITSLFLVTPVLAQDQRLTPEQQALLTKWRGILSSIHPQYGDISVPGADTTLHLGQDFYYLSPDDARKVLTEGWGNPPDATSGELGMIFPKDKNFVSSHWGAVLLFNPEGYVPSVDAKQEDFDRAAQAIRDSEDSANAERKKEGAVPIHFVGWAQPPSFDNETHTIVWARDLKFGADTTDTLNYDVRTLGRRGSSVIRIVAPMTYISEIRPIANQLVHDMSFNVGARYEDYNAGSDKKATYGIAGMVAAGAGVVLAQKLGVFALIAVFAKKAIVLVGIAIAAMVGWIRRMLGLKPVTAKSKVVTKRLPPPET